MSRRAAPDAADRGQATVELALAMPVVCLVLLGAVQVAVVVRDHVAVVAAARAAARAAAVSAAPADAARRAVAGAPPGPLQVTTAVAGGTVTVTVTYVDPTDVPLIGALVPPATVSASATMVLEPP